MSTKKPDTQLVSAFLSPGYRDLTTIMSKVKAIDKLHQTLQEILPDELRQYVRVANLSNGILVALVANGAVATQLRYHNRTLIKKLHKNPALNHIKEIQVKVRPDNPTKVFERPVDKKKLRKAASPLGQDAADILIDMAQTIDDPRIRKTLEKIARHNNKKATKD